MKRFSTHLNFKGYKTPFESYTGACGSNGDKLFFCHGQHIVDFFGMKIWQQNCWETDDLSSWKIHSKPLKKRTFPSVAATKGSTNEIIFVIISLQI